LKFLLLAEEQYCREKLCSGALAKEYSSCALRAVLESTALLLVFIFFAFKI